MNPINLRSIGALSVASFLALAGSVQAQWINRFAKASDVTGNGRFFSLVNAFPSECPIVAIRNTSGYPVVVRNLRFINSRYIGQGNPNLDDWHITVRKSLSEVLGMTTWTSNARVFRVGPPSQWSNFPGAFDTAGNPVQDTQLRSLERFKILIPAHSVTYLGLANRASVANGFTATMMTDWRLPDDDYGFISTVEPPVKTISVHTNGSFTNLAINVEVARVPGG